MAVDLVPHTAETHHILAERFPAVTVKCSMARTDDYTVSNNKSVVWQCEHRHHWKARNMARRLCRVSTQLPH